MLKWSQKLIKTVAQITTCDFSIFAKCITLESFFRTIMGIQNGAKMMNNCDKIVDAKTDAKNMPKLIKNDAKWDPKWPGKVPKTMPEHRPKNCPKMAPCRRNLSDK